MHKLFTISVFPRFLTAPLIVYNTINGLTYTKSWKNRTSKNFRNLEFDTIIGLTVKKTRARDYGGLAPRTHFNLNIDFRPKF